MVAVQPVTTATLPASSNNNTIQILYFHAPWAEPCKQMSTVITHLASTYNDPSQIAFYSIDAEELPELAEEHDVEAVPFIAIKSGGKTVDSVSGGDAAKVRTAVEKHANPQQGSKTQLPPQQSVIRPAQQPEPKEQPSVTNGVHAATASTQSSGTPAKNMSAYAPSASDPPTAPAMSSAATQGATSQEDLDTRLAELVKAAPVMLFMKGTPSAPQCGFSRQLVSILRENGVRYGFFNILADDEVRQGLKVFSDWPTFPQLYMGGELVGGLDIVREEIERDAGFFADYAVDTRRNTGGPAAPGLQAAPTAA